MARAVFTHADGSSYDDWPEVRYHFPQTYLRAVGVAVGDWIIYYEPRRVEAGSERAGGRQAYFATAKLRRIERDRRRENHFYAYVSDYAAFPEPVPFRAGSDYYESLLKRPDGGTNKGAFGRSVRLVPEAEFDAILAAGVAGVREVLGAEDWGPEDWGPEDWGPEDWGPEPGGRFGLGAGPGPGLHDPLADFTRPILERLIRKPFREAAFARQLEAAYGARCAMTGLLIRNGGGRPEVQAAHIMPVAAGGPDTVRNGLALCGTAHWMFDRGLLSVDEDMTILIARNHVPAAMAGLIVADRKLLVPAAAHLRPERGYLARHRAEFKGQGASRVAHARIIFSFCSLCESLLAQSLQVQDPLRSGISPAGESAKPGQYKGASERQATARVGGKTGL